MLVEDIEDIVEKFTRYFDNNIFSQSERSAIQFEAIAGDTEYSSCEEGAVTLAILARVILDDSKTGLERQKILLESLSGQFIIT